MAFPFAPLQPRVDLLVGGASWRDVTDDVAFHHGAAQIRRGRSDWASQVDPSSCTVALKNNDGTYTPQNATSDLYGLIGRNTPLRVGVGLPILGAGAVDADPGTDHDAPTVTAEAAGLLVCAWMTSDPGNYTVPGGFTGDTEQDGAVSTFRCARKSIGVGATGVSTATFSVSPDWIAAVSVAVPGASITQASAAATGTAGDDVTVTVTAAAAGDWLLAVHGWSADPNDLMTAAPADVENPTAGWYLIEDTGANGDDGPRLKVWARRALYAGEQNIVFRGRADDATDNAARVYALAGVTAYYPRATTEIASWPSRWIDTGADVWAPLNGAGVMRRLGAPGRLPARSALHRLFVVDPNTLAYWPLEESEGALVFGAGVPDVEKLTVTGAPDMGGYDDFECSDPVPTWATAKAHAPVPLYSDPGNWYAGALVALPEAGTADEAVLLQFDTYGTAASWVLRYDDSGTGAIRLQVFDGAATSLLDTSLAFDDLDGRQFFLYVRVEMSGSDVLWNVGVHRIQEGLAGADSDEQGGTLVAQTHGAIRAVTVSSLEVTGDVAIGHLLASLHDPFDGESYPDAAALEALSAWWGEPAAERVARLCREERIACWTQADSTSEPMGYQKPGKILDLLRQCEATDMGFLHEPLGFVGLAYRCRGTLQNQNTVTLNRLTLDCSDNALAPLEPTEDDQGLVNDLTVRRVGGASARGRRITGALSVHQPPNGVGPYKKTVDLSLASDDQLIDQAGWRVHVGSWDEPRYPTVPVDFAGNQTLLPNAMSVDLGDVTVVESLPAWVADDEVDVMIQGWSETIGAFTWDWVANCTPYGPWRVAQDGIEAGLVLDEYVLPISGPGGGPFTEPDVEPGDETFVYVSDADQSWEVPAGVTEVAFDVVAARGGGATGWVGAGPGGRVQGTLSGLTPGETLTIRVGESGDQVSSSGGWPGGGNNGGGGVVPGRRGGGYAGIFRSATALVVAGAGGGGSTTNAGGAGGGTTGAAGAGTTPGGGGTQAAGGAAGAGEGSGSTGTAGSSLQGGNGGNGNPAGGNGGGGGYFGGGGGGGSSTGAADGGGGGSSYTDAAACTDVVHTQGYNDGTVGEVTNDGWITLTWGS